VCEIITHFSLQFYLVSLHDALPISTVTIMLFCWIGICLIDLIVLLISMAVSNLLPASIVGYGFILLQYGAFLLLALSAGNLVSRSEEYKSELQSCLYL